MAHIIVTNSCIKITDYDLGDCPKLERSFQKYNPITHSMDILGMYYSVKTRTLFLPRGLDLWLLKHWLEVKNYESVSPNPFDSIEILMKYKPRDEVQEEALKFMIGLDNYDRNEFQPQLSINLPTGKGKTYCSIATIAFMKIKSIVITGSNSLLTQWKENIKEYTDLTEQDILFISGSPMINMILTDKSQKAKTAKIFLCTHGTIRSFCDQYGWTKLDLLFTKLGIGMKFIDEAHLNFNNMLMVDFFSNVYKTFYVTATPERSSWEENKIFQLSLKNVPSIDLFNQNTDPHTEYIAIKFNSHPTAMDISRCKNAYGLDRNKYTDYITKNKYFYQMMYIIMDMYLKFNGRGIFYIGTNDALLRVYKWIGNNYPQLIGDIGIFTSIMTKEQKQLEKQKKLILSTTKSAGAGEHIEHLKVTVVLAEPFKSAVLAKQTLGRTRDKDTVYIELVDLGFRKIRDYYYSKLKIFNKYATETSDTVIEQYELDRRSEIIRQRQEEKVSKSPIYFRDERFFDYTDRNDRKVFSKKPIFFY